MPEPPPSPFSHPGFQGCIGVARDDITPPVGIYARNWGAATQDTAEGVHRPLTATALTLQQRPEDAPLVLISLDLGWWRSYRDEWYVRGYLLETLDLPPERVMLAFTHTHAGPVLCRDDNAKSGGDLIAPYLDFLRETAVHVVQSALTNAVPATLEWRYGRCGLAANRDMPDRERPRFVCGFNPTVPADDTLLIGRVTGSEDECLATLVNYACHPTTLAWQNRLLSPDFVGAMRDVVEAYTGQAPCLFLQGASGELAPREQYTADAAIADAHGRELGFAALSTLAGMLPARTQLAGAGVIESGAPLALWKREPKTVSTRLAASKTEVEFPLQSLPTLAELDAQISVTSDRTLKERLARKRRIREGVGEGASARMPIWSWQVGEALFIGHPNEAYSQLQTELREKFSGRPVVVINVVNGHYGYLPPSALYEADLYPVWQTPFGRGSLERLQETCGEAARLLLSLRNQT